MIKSFNTNISASTPASTGGSASSTKTFITIAVVVAVAIVGYKFVIKPMLDKKEENK
jgi:Tfp pilus assembly protein PilO